MYFNLWILRYWSHKKSRETSAVPEGLSLALCIWDECPLPRQSKPKFQRHHLDINTRPKSVELFSEYSSSYWWRYRGFCFFLFSMINILFCFCFFVSTHPISLLLWTRGFPTVSLKHALRMCDFNNVYQIWKGILWRSLWGDFPNFRIKIIVFTLTRGVDKK